jgi:hypothetical protein
MARAPGTADEVKRSAGPPDELAMKQLVGAMIGRMLFLEVDRDQLEGVAQQSPVSDPLYRWLRRQPNAYQWNLVDAYELGG